MNTKRHTKRLKEIESKELDSGKHDDFSEGGCVMEMVSYLAGESWSDRPECACPVLTNYAIAINDRFSNKHRQLLKPLIPMLVNTRSTDAVQIARKRFIIWRYIAVTYPLILDLIKLPDVANALRAFKNTAEDMDCADVLLNKNKEKVYAIAYANAYANANAYAIADASAIAIADAYAIADAATRAQLAASSIETLRFACGIKEKI